jgi:uncharacterized membrane protein
VNQPPPNNQHPHHGGALTIGRRLTNYFLTGFVIAAPLGVAIYVTWWVISFVDDLVKPIIPAAYNPDEFLPVHVPGFGLVFAVVAIMILGFLTANFVGRTLVQFGESVVARIPFFSVVYRSVKHILETVVAQGSANFKEVGIIEYPRPGLYALVFVSTTTKGEISVKAKGEDVVSVFLPTTPNPTSGYLLFVPRRDIVVLDMSVEDAAKLVVSAGLVAPEYQEATRKLVEDAKKTAVAKPGASKPAEPKPDTPKPDSPKPAAPKRPARKPPQAAE